MQPLPLTKRPLDLLYVVFFVVHIPASILIDLQTLYPPSLVPGWMSPIMPWYLNMSGDPVTAGGMGLYGQPLHTLWLRSFFWIEALFQFPCFFIGIWAITKGKHAWYPLLIAYSASTLTTMVPVLAYLLSYPSSQHKAKNYETITEGQRWQVFGSMVPWVLIPAALCIDLSIRIARVLGSMDRMALAKKST
ncbi:transmembrane protein 6/97 [Auriculariales sp. MPI-PUGE-AT-0066]|nr:transmembrane protein 6/97 [Auriculariales sp. MPI-PUGE-AT-0066]